MKNINGLSVYTEGDTSGIPLLFVHGYPFSAAMWKKQIEFFKGEYYCVSYDIRGLGNSDKGDGLFTMEQFADDLLLITEELNLDKPVVISLSMGGYVTFRALEKKPDGFRAAIFCGTKSEGDGNEARLKRAAAVKKVNEAGAGTFIREFIPGTFWEKNISALGEEYERFVKELLSTPAATLKGCQLAMAGRTDSSHILPMMNIPALFICGEYDTFSPPQIMNRDAENWKESQFVLIRDAGHLSPFERPPEVNTAIKEFLKKL